MVRHCALMLRTDWQELACVVVVMGHPLKSTLRRDMRVSIPHQRWEMLTPQRR